MHLDQSSHLPSNRPPTTDNVGIGRAVARLEDERLLRGGSRYVSDLIATSRALRVKVLRSPHAHARILEVDATAVRTLPGVVDVLTANELTNISDLPCDWAPGMDVVPQHPVLARDRVRYAGEPIAGVVAETAHAAEGALATAGPRGYIEEAAASALKPSSKEKPLRRGKRGRTFGRPPGIVLCPAIGPAHRSVK